MPKLQKKAPKHLSLEARRFVERVWEAYELSDHHDRLLIEAAGALDRANAARAELDKKQSLIFIDRHGNEKASPLIQVESTNRALFAKLLKDLRLDETPPEKPSGLKF